MWLSNLCDRLSDLSPTLLRSLTDVTGKGAVILAIAWLATSVMRRASAAARHLVWFLAVVCLLILPILSSALPGWNILPHWAPAQIAPASFSVDVKPEPVVSTAKPIPPISDTHLLPNYSPPPPRVDLPSSPVAPQPMKPTFIPAKPPAHLSWQGWIILVWLGMALLNIAWILVGLASLGRLQRRSSPIQSEALDSLLSEVRSTLGFHRAVKVITAAQRSMPMTWGLWNTWILLPADSVNWTPAQRRAVLLHELAHARRWDCQTQLIAHLACALHWFNPLAWLAYRKMQTAREQACDDLVLSTGTRASAYAEQLLEIASEMPPIKYSTAAIAMARPSALEGRLVAILDVKRNRRALTLGAGLSALILMGTIAAPLAMLHAGDLAQTPPALVENKTPTPVSTAAPVALVANPSGRLGRVVDSQGRPIGHAIVRSVVSQWTVQTAEDGTFQLPESSSARTEQLVVTAPGFARKENVSAMTGPDGKTLWPDAGVITLYRSARLEGIVLGANGKPLAGAPVSANVYFLKGGFMADAIRGISDENGRFVIDDVPPGEMALEYPWLGPTDQELHEGRWKKWTKPGQPFPPFPEKGGTGIALKVDEGQVRSDLVLDLSKSIATAQGRVVDQNGQPVANAAVYLCCKLSRGSTGICSQGIPDVKTDGEGRYTFEKLPLGNWYLEAFVGNALAPPVPVVLSESTATVTDLVLPIVKSPSGRIRRVNPMNPDETVREWIDATLAGDAEGAQQLVVPGSAITLADDRLHALLPQIKSFPTSSENSLGQGEATSNDVTFDDGHPGNLKFKLVGKSGQWKLTDAVDVAIDANAVAAQPATKPIATAQSAILDFRIAAWTDANIDKPDGVLFPPAVAKQFVQDLEKNGPHKIDGFDWFEIGKTSGMQPVVVGTFHRKKYILLATSDSNVMLAERHGPRTWGLTHVGAKNDQRGDPVIEFVLDPPGAQRFGKLTETHLHRPIAILVDNKVQLLATIQTKLDSTAMISLGKEVDPAAVDAMVQSLTNGMPAAAQPDPTTRPASGDQSIGEVFVTGHVQRPGAYALSNKGILTLLQLVTAAGLDSSDVVVVLHRNGGKDIQEFNLNGLIKGTLADPPVQAGDVAIVSGPAVKHVDPVPTTQKIQPATTQPAASMATPDRERLYRQIAGVDKAMALNLRIRENDQRALDNIRPSLGPRHPEFVMLQKHLAESQRRVSDYADAFLRKNPNFILLGATQPALAPVAPAMQNAKTDAKFGAGSIDKSFTVKLWGQVVDDQTGEPIEHYSLQDGFVDAKDLSKSRWGGEMTSSKWAEGAFQHELSIHPDGPRWLRVLAPGYLPQPVTSQPIWEPGDQKDLIVRLKKAADVHGLVLDDSGKPVAGALVIAAGTQSLTVQDGKVGEHYEGSQTKTDGDGRFVLALEAGNRIVISSPTLDAYLVPKDQMAGELTIRLPKPASMTIHYDIDGSNPEASIRAQLTTWDMPDWREARVEIVRTLKCRQGAETVVSNLMPGNYDIVRQQHLRAAEAIDGFFLDRSTQFLKSGENTTVDFVRKTGRRINGRVIGLASTGRAVATISVRPFGVTGDDSNAKENLLPIFDAVTCTADGLFETSRLSPGKYTVIAQVYDRDDDPRDLGWRLPAWVARQDLVVPETGEPQPPQLELKLAPRKDVASAATQP